jgi:glycosyltransferase involved in cell wall biosynthesis
MSAADSIVSWHPVLTVHQSHTLQALAHVTGRRLTVMVARGDDPTRKAQGWTRPDTGALEVRSLEGPRGPGEIRRVLLEHRDAVHLFGSPFDEPRFMLALWRALRMGLRVYLISEPYSPDASGYLHDRARLAARIKSHLRPAVYRLYGALLKRRLQGVFAISPLAVSQYRSIGIPPARIHPFGYFVPSTGHSRPSALRSGDRPGCRAIFVGSLIATKGLAQLVSAARRLHGAGLDLHIDVYGAGDPSAFAFDGTAIRHAGRIPFGQAQAVIANYDFLVLPSRYDGWGVVVNEAILAGVPVVCSDRVGAGAFVRRWGCGIVYPSDTAEGLDDALRTLATSHAARRQMAEACLHVRHKLDPEVAARYVADVIATRGQADAAPANPWYDV